MWKMKLKAFEFHERLFIFWGLCTPPKYTTKLRRIRYVLNGSIAIITLLLAAGGCFAFVVKNIKTDRNESFGAAIGVCATLGTLFKLLSSIIQQKRLANLVVKYQEFYDRCMYSVTYLYNEIRWLNRLIELWLNFISLDSRWKRRLI